MPNASENVGVLTLSPRQVATGSPAGFALENINTRVVANGAFCYVATGPGQGEWQLQKEATTAPDGATIVAPIAGPGRWFKKIGPGVPSSGGGNVLEELFPANMGNFPGGIEGRASPWLAPRDMEIQKMYYWTDAIGSASDVQLGIYDESLNLLRATAIVPIAVGRQSVNLTSPLALTAENLYYLAVGANNNTPVFLREDSSGLDAYVTGSPLPNPLISTSVVRAWVAVSEL